MRRLAAALLGLLLAPPLGVEAAARQRKFTRDIPKQIWVPIFFEGINKRAKSAGLPSLRAPLREGEMELRVWEIDSLSGVSGFRMWRTRKGWSASYLGSVYSRGRVVDFERHLVEPKSGWEGAWNQFAGLGVLSLPDAYATDCSAAPGMRDGRSYVIETNAGRAYRTYLYDNPNTVECAEAKRVLSVARTIVGEFGVQEFTPLDDWSYRP